MKCYQISSVAVCVELTEFLDNIFNMAIFKPKFHFFETLKANMVKPPKRVMAIKFLAVPLASGQVHSSTSLVCH